MRYVAPGLLPLLTLVFACMSGSKTVHGLAQVITWNDQVMVVALCDSQRHYQLGVSTSNAALGLREVGQALEGDSRPVLVELTGFFSSLPSSWTAAQGVVGVLSVGRISVVGRESCI